jgi:glycosyltransferase involved in cell wall biosynthesis
VKILFLAPQPFYQERGTPIAVRLALEALCKKLKTGPHQEPIVDLLVYDEGTDVEIDGIRIHRIPTPAFLKGIRPGISVKKLLCDVIFLFVTFKMLWQARKAPYAVIHAVEESVFIAWLGKQLFKTPYVYDMDSSLALQLTEKWWILKPALPFFGALERVVVQGSIAVAPVCDALQAIATKHGSRNTVMLRDVSLLPESNEQNRPLRTELGLQDDQPLIVYVGNLESYQGIDLLIESFARACSHPSSPILAIIGGSQAAIDAYKQKAMRFGCAERVSFLGPRPVATLRDLLFSADIVVSPRIKGNNTPMKVYSYLHCGRALLATNLPTHTQVVDGTTAILTAPTPTGFADGMLLLLSDPGLREEIASRAKARAERLYTVAAFEAQLSALYDKVQESLPFNTPKPALAVGEKLS